MTPSQQWSENIPQEIKIKIVQEANWRSTNGHGGVDDITRDNFILAAEYGYGLAQPAAPSTGDTLRTALEAEVDRLTEENNKLKYQVVRMYFND